MTGLAARLARLYQWGLSNTGVVPVKGAGRQTAAPNTLSTIPWLEFPVESLLKTWPLYTLLLASLQLAVCGYSTVKGAAWTLKIGNLRRRRL